jgi:hypothetical protein
MMTMKSCSNRHHQRMYSIVTVLLHSLLIQLVLRSLGVGAPIPANFNPKSHGSTDALRRAMLGGRKPTKAMPQWEKQPQRKVVAPDDSDEDTGRSALGGTKRKRSVGNDLRKTKIAKSEIPRERPASDKAELRSEPPQAVVEVGNSISKKKKKNKKRQQLIE